jgi:hypothetical protein
MRQHLEFLGRQLFVGLGQVATRALAAGAKSAVADIDHAANLVKKRARKVRDRIDGMIGGGAPSDMSNWNDEED